MTPVVAAETNFVVQAFTRRDETEEAEAAEGLLRLAAEGRVVLAIPCFSLLEAEFTLRQARKRRNALAKGLEGEEKELRRSPLSTASAAELAAFRRSVVKIEQKESNAYYDTLNTLLEFGRPIPLDAATIRGALASPVERLDLADAIVLQSIIDYLHALDDLDSPRFFLNYNKSDFDNPDVRTTLERQRCTLHTDARALLAALRAT